MRGEPRDAPDEDLVDRLPADAVALEELYRRHVRALTGYATRRLGDPVEAADVVAGVFVEVIESAGSYDRRRGSPRAWMFGIAANLVATHARRQVAEARALRRVYGRRVLDPDDHARLEEQIDAARRSRELRTALATLPPAERELFLLVSLDGLAPAEAAKVLGIGSAAARMRLARARRKLSRALVGEAVEEADEVMTWGRA